MFVSRCCIFCSWCNWCYCWCISRRSFGSVLIFTNHCYRWCSTDEWFFWDEGYCTVCCYCVCTNTFNCLSCWTIIKCCWNSIVHWHTAVAFSEFRFTSLSRTLDISRFSWSCCWSYWGHSWRVLSCDFSTVFINTFHCYAWSSSSEWFFWDEGYGSIWRNSVCSFTIYCLSGWTIFEGSWSIFIDWNIWISFCEDWFTRLCLALDISRCSIFRSWNNRSNLRCISCFNCSSICISCLNLNWDHITWIRFICRCEGHNTCFFINGEGTDHITCWWFRFYWCCWLTIFIKKGNRILVNWSNFVTLSEGYSSSLNYTLRSSRISWCCSWSYWCYGWCVSCRGFGAVLIFTNNRYSWRFTCEWFLWNKGYCSVWCYCVGTNAIHCLGSWTIVKCCWNVIVHWHTAVAFSKFRLTCLSLTLLTCSFNWCRCRAYWSYCWCVSCRSFGAVLIFTNNCYCWSCSSKWFLRNKGYCSVCCYCVGTNTIYCLGSWAIVKCCRNSFIDVYCFLNAINGYCTTLEFRFTCLSGTLNISGFSWCCCWAYWNDFRCVSCINFNSIWTFSLNLNWCHSTCVGFISWCEGYLASCWINWVSTDFSCTVCRISWCRWNFVTIFV